MGSSAAGGSINYSENGIGRYKLGSLFTSQPGPAAVFFAGPSSTTTSASAAASGSSGEGETVGVQAGFCLGSSPSSKSGKQGRKASLGRKSPSPQRSSTLLSRFESVKGGIATPPPPAPAHFQSAQLPAFPSAWGASSSTHAPAFAASAEPPAAAAPQPTFWSQPPQQPGPPPPAHTPAVHLFVAAGVGEAAFSVGMAGMDWEGVTHWLLAFRYHPPLHHYHHLVGNPQYYFSIIQ